VAGSVSPERIREELSRMLLDANRAAAFRLLGETGLLDVVLPEVAACRGVRQPEKYHPEGDVLVHVLKALEQLAPDASEAVAWGVLLHDIGKPGTFTEGPDRVRFHGHDVLGATLAGAIAERLRFSNALRERVVLLVRRHLLLRDAPKMKRGRLRALLAEPWLDELAQVARADAQAGSGDVSHVDFVDRARVEIGAELPPPLLKGDDLRELGIAPGPAYGRILATLRDEQLEGTLATREAALERARSLASAS
jgi:poly(A) polymerase